MIDRRTKDHVISVSQSHNHRTIISRKCKARSRIEKDDVIKIINQI